MTSWHRPGPWLVGLVVCVAIGAGAPAWSQARVAARYAVTADDLAAGRAALDALPVRGRAPSTGYARERFGQAWADVDRNGCDTRNDILRRDLTDDRRSSTAWCSAARSTTPTRAYRSRSPADPTRRPSRSTTSSRSRTPGRRARSSGPRREREAFANDPANLLAVDGPANQEKGAGDAATWLPPNRGYRCVYALRQVRVKAAYGLWVTAAGA